MTRKRGLSSDDIHIEYEELDETKRKIMRLVGSVKADETSFGPLSTGEKIAVALVMDRTDWLRDYGTILQAVDRLGEKWLDAALAVQRDM